MGKLDPYAGSFGRREAGHLLKRTCFGASNAQIDKAVDDGLNKTINNLFATQPAPPPPIDPDTGVTWVGLPYDPVKGNGYFNGTTKSWWTELMVLQPISVREKMTMFWSNHFATEMTVVGSAQMAYDLLAYFRANALGNFKQMTRDATLMPAMLRYLNGNTNTKGSPNENYARELQELFTIGKGPEVSQGNYTTYTEDDVKAAARVLTGWRDERGTGRTIFNANQHDTADKQFSANYQNTVVKGLSGATAGDGELDALLTMIFAQNATSEYIVGKLYRWFVDSALTQNVMDEIVKPLAAQLRADGWVVEKTVKTLLKSAHFFSPEMAGCQLRSPADFTIGLLRAATTWTPPTDISLRDRFFKSIHSNMQAQQMDLNEPSSVAGWEVYYQSPSYYRLWLTTATLPLRNGTSDSVLLNNNALNRKPILASPEFIQSLGTEVTDPYRLVEILNEIFFAVAFTENQVKQLVNEVLSDNAPDYTWTQNYTDWTSAPTTAKYNVVKGMADRLLKYMFRMAEMQIG